MENKTGKYFKYAIGEIILVMIGILLALQVNNWNEKRIEKQTLTNYYERMYEELESSRDNLSRNKNEIEFLANENRKTLKILSANNQDSLPLLKTTLGALGTGYTNQFNYPIIEEFIREGYLAKVKNTNIKDNLQAFSIQLTYSNALDKSILNQYHSIIEPFINKHLNYSQIALEIHKEELELGGPETNFNALFNNLEAWNVITLKLEMLVTHGYSLQGFEAMIDCLTKSLATELNLSQND